LNAHRRKPGWHTQNLAGHTSTVRSIQLDTSETFVVAGSAGGTVKLWDLEVGKGIAHLILHYWYSCPLLIVLHPQINLLNSLRLKLFAHY
jgi:WD40 repeat protein